MRMKALYIARQLLISLLLTGFVAHMMMPLSSQAKKTAFTQWLNQNLVSSGDETEIMLRNTIRELPVHSESFDALLEEATRLIKENRNGFTILFTHENSDEERNISNWLIGQWNAFQNQQSGKFGTLADAQSLLVKILNHQVLGGSHDISERTQHLGSHSGSYEVRFIISSFLKLPLVGGISINAP